MFLLLAFGCLVSLVTVRFLMDSLGLAQWKPALAAQEKWPMLLLQGVDCLLRADTTVSRSWRVRRSLSAAAASSYSKYPSTSSSPPMQWANCSVAPVLLSSATPTGPWPGRNLTRTLLISSVQTVPNCRWMQHYASIILLEGSHVVNLTLR